MAFFVQISPENFGSKINASKCGKKCQLSKYFRASFRRNRLELTSGENPEKSLAVYCGTLRKNKKEGARYKNLGAANE